MIGKLLTAFKDIKYYDKTHSYFLNGKRLTSVTTLIKEYETPFEEEYWLVYKVLQSKGHKLKSHASKGVNTGHLLVDGETYDYKTARKKFDVDIKALRKQWKQIAKTATDKGKDVHSYLEAAWRGKYFGASNFVCDKFIDEHSSYLIPVCLEFIVSDPEYNLAGQMDALMFNTTTKKFEIYDYKTDKEIEMSNRFQSFKEPLNHLDQCNFNKYMLQLNLYKWCIERYTDVEISALNIVHFNESHYKKYTLNINTRLVQNLLEYDRRRRTVNAKASDKRGKRRL